jgi:hypothetical protein
MKSYITLLLVSIFIFSCTQQDTKETTLLDFVPNNPSVVIYTPSITDLQNDLKDNTLLKEFKNTDTYKSTQQGFQFFKSLKSDNPVLISFSKVGKSLEFLLSINIKNTENKIAVNPDVTTYNNKNYQKLKDQNAYSIVLDSTLVVTSSEILIENLIRNNNANIRYSNTSLLKLYKTSDNSKTTAFINLEKKPAILNTLFPITYLATTDWIAAELNNENGISINGVATNTKTTHEFASKLINSSTEKSHSSVIIPSNFTEYTSYNFNELKFISEFENFNELVDGSTEIVSFKDGKHQVCAFKLLNTTISENLTSHTTYRNHTIYKNDYFKIPATICNPQPEFACYIEDFIILSSNLESLQNCISHFQNETTLRYQNYYAESSDALLSEAHIIKSQKTNTIKDRLATVLNDESIRKVNLKDFPLAMHQITYEDTYIQFNSVLKKITKQKNTTSVSQISSITLDANLATNIQWVTNHRTKQKELLVQDINNQLYLISNKGAILWKKQLKGKIQGDVIQVDLFKNKKLQLAFTTENEFMVLDRNGKLVDQFHKIFSDGNLLPLAVFDYDRNRNYRFIITQGSKVYMYDNNFKLVKGFEFNTAKSSIITTPKHVRIGTKDYIIIAENNGKLHILNRQGQRRTSVKSTFDFSPLINIERQGNNLLFKDEKHVITQVNIATGKVTKSDILQGDSNHFSVNDNLIVKLEDEKLTIKNKTIELDLGNYTSPEIFYLNKKYYISVTDIDTRKVYLFDSNATVLEKFPVYGQSKISATNMDSDKHIEFAVKGEDNSILIYKM